MKKTEAATRTVTITDVPSEKLPQVIADVHDDGAIKISSSRQPNGKFTVIATFPAE